MSQAGEAVESIAGLWENAADVLLDVLADEDNDLTDDSRADLAELRRDAQEHAAVLGRIADRLARL